MVPLKSSVAVPPMASGFGVALTSRLPSASAAGAYTARSESAAIATSQTRRPHLRSRMWPPSRLAFTLTDGSRVGQRAKARLRESSWNGAAKESNLPSVGLPRPAGFEDRMGHQTRAAPPLRLRQADGLPRALAVAVDVPVDDAAVAELPDVRYLRVQLRVRPADAGAHVQQDQVAVAEVDDVLRLELQIVPVRGDLLERGPNAFRAVEDAVQEQAGGVVVAHGGVEHRPVDAAGVEAFVGAAEAIGVGGSHTGVFGSNDANKHGIRCLFRYEPVL